MVILALLGSLCEAFAGDERRCADVGQPLAGLLWGVRASDDGAAASLWAARACGGASSVEDVELGSARYGFGEPSPR